MNSDIYSWLTRVKATVPSIESIWLVGSRANGHASERSDWDLIAFGTRETLEQLHNAGELHRPGVDFLVVVNGEDFENAWGERNKTGALSSWQWKPVSDACAEYTEAKWIDTEEESKVVLRSRKAIRV